MTIIAAERSLLGTIVDLAVWAGEVVEFLVHGIIIAFMEWGEGRIGYFSYSGRFVYS